MYYVNYVRWRNVENSFPVSAYARASGCYISDCSTQLIEHITRWDFERALP